MEFLQLNLLHDVTGGRPGRCGGAEEVGGGANGVSGDGGEEDGGGVGVDGVVG